MKNYGVPQSGTIPIRRAVRDTTILSSSFLILHFLCFPQLFHRVFHILALLEGRVWDGWIKRFLLNLFLLLYLLLYLILFLFLVLFLAYTIFVPSLPCLLAIFVVSLRYVSLIRSSFRPALHVPIFT